MMPDISGSHSAANAAHRQAQTVLRTLRTIAGMLWRASPGGVLLIALMPAVQASIAALQIYVTRAMVDAAALVAAQGSSYLPGAYRILSCQLGLSFLTYGLQMLEGLVHTRLRQRLYFYQEELITAKVGRLPLTFFESPEAYDMLQRTAWGSRGLTMAATALQVVRNMLTVLSFVAILISIHWALAVGVALVAVPSFIANSRLGEYRLARMYENVHAGRVTGYLSGLFRQRESAKEVRLFGLSSYLLTRWSDQYWQVAERELAVERRTAATTLGVESFSLLTGGASGAFLLWLSAGSTITLGTYVAIAQALGSAQSRMDAIAQAMGRLYEDSLFASEFQQFLELPEECQANSTTPFPTELKESISVEGLTFTFPGSDRPALQDISFEVKPGQRVAIVGANGAGKTTLVKCLLGLYPPTGGTVRFDGVRLHDMDRQSLWKNVSAVFQDFVRYQMTVRENIGFGSVDQMDDIGALQKAAARGAADEVVAGLPKGYETMLGATFSGGRELSQGQWQKIALSRAFFRDAQVVALDEPTAALDPATEVAVFERFADLTDGKTALLVSHRMASCRRVDKILVLKKGRLVEQGTHEELMVLNGEYAEMVRLQSKVSV